MNREVSSVGGHRRNGFPIFVDNVSKRIHHSSLREAFEIYGSVVDVFVAYKNQKRKNKATTFAFIRFRSKMEALGAIRLANGRRMDGHYIRVFRANERSVNSDISENKRNPLDVGMSKKDSSISYHRRDGVSKENGSSANQAGIQRVAVHSDRRRWSFKDTRTFREALLGKKKPDLQDQVSAQTMKAQADEDAISDVTMVMVEEYPTILAADSCRVKSKCIPVPKSNMEWRKLCLVGNIKKMYNVELVQEALRSDGFQVSVCPWHDLLVIVRFQNIDERNRCWANRKELIDIWFEELELLEGFEGKRKVKAWVKLFDVPLGIWSSEFFNNLGNRWGEVLKVDEETDLLLRFDYAKLLIQVQKISSIPDRISIVVNGVTHQIKVTTEFFEEERIFIDGEEPVRWCGDVDDSASDSAPALNVQAAASKSTEAFPMQQRYDEVGEFQGLVLHDVPINCMGSSELGLSNGSSNDYGPVLGTKEIVADLVPKGIKLLKIPVKVIESNFQVEENDNLVLGENSVPVPMEASQILPKKGRKTQRAVGCDRVQRAAPQLPGRAKISKKFRRSKSCDSRLGSEMKGIVGKSAMVLFSSSHSNQNKESREEAVKVLEFGKSHGIEFDAPDEVLISRIVNLEKREGLGLGRTEKLRAVAKALCSRKARVVFLQETKLSALKPWALNRLKGRTLDECASSPANGASGGLLSLWDSSFFALESQIVKERTIFLIGKLVNCNLKCGLVNIYAPNADADRGEFFESLSQVIENLQISIIIGGDFNTVKTADEKIGAAPNVGSMRRFNEFIERNNLIGLPVSGNPFTWCRGNQGFVASMIDRFLVSPEVMVSLPNISQCTFPRGLSDHRPVILLETNAESGPKPFKWFSYWADEPELKELISNVVSTHPSCDASGLLKQIKRVTKGWASARCSIKTDTTSILENKIKELEDKICKEGCNDSLSAEISRLQSELWIIHRREEREWLQKSRLRWFSEGDKNTRLRSAKLSKITSIVVSIALPQSPLRVLVVWEGDCGLVVEFGHLREGS
ncbi:hypothetical protein GQ457_04G028760 [Hibiscus cannabinus]